MIYFVGYYCWYANTGYFTTSPSDKSFSRRRNIKIQNICSRLYVPIIPSHNLKQLIFIFITFLQSIEISEDNVRDCTTCKLARMT